MGDATRYSQLAIREFQGEAHEQRAMGSMTMLTTSLGSANRVKLTIATTDYDHFRDFRTGAVEAQGIEHTWLTLGHHEIFSRFTFNREWDVTELSFAKFTAQVTRDNPDIIGLPVLPSRLFLFGLFSVNRRIAIKIA